MAKKTSPKIVLGLNLDDPNLYSEANKVFHQNTKVDLNLRDAMAFQKKVIGDASQLVTLYWAGYPKAHNADYRKFAAHLVRTPITNPWQIICLIEAAGAVALELGMSKHKADIASMKNDGPRRWVREQWNLYEHKKGNKASFSKQYAAHVKKQYDVTVTSETISRNWLKGM